MEMALSYLRLDSDSSDYVLRRYALDAILRSCVRKYARLFILKRIELELDETHAKVLTDEKWLSFVIGQLLSNALKYTPEQGHISVTWADATQTLTIEDTGIGIRPEDLPRVFEKGFTGHNGREQKKSTGIGLYLCRRVLGKLGHTIAITSTPGRNPGENRPGRGGTGDGMNPSDDNVQDCKVRSRGKQSEAAVRLWVRIEDEKEE